jgi:hypothetical protein
MKFSTAFFLFLSVMTAACSTADELGDSRVLSQATQNIQWNGQSQPVNLVVESGACATNLPKTSLTDTYCFNPVAAINFNLISTGDSRPAFCVATHLAGMAPEAALLVVDSSGRYVSEASGRMTTQVFDTLSQLGQYRFYVGFPSAAAGQKATIRIGKLSSFAMRSPACSWR